MCKSFVTIIYSCVIVSIPLLHWWAELFLCPMGSQVDAFMPCQDWCRCCHIHPIVSVLVSSLCHRGCYLFRALRVPSVTFADINAIYSCYS